jgi:hypothetical protein
VHGMNSSSEYAKRRKESLETEFRHILGARSRALFAYTRFSPFFALYRASIVSFEVAKLTFWHFSLKDIHKRAEKVVISFPFVLVSLYINCILYIQVFDFFTSFNYCSHCIKSLYGKYNYVCALQDSKISGLFRCKIKFYLNWYSEMLIK